MPRQGLAALCGLMVAGAVGLLLAADKDQVRSDVLKLAETVGKNDTLGVEQQATEIAKKSQLEDVMDLMKTRSKKGLGVGPVPNAISPDGIEAQIINLRKRALRPKDLEMRSKDLAQAARVAAAIAAIARHSCPVTKKEGPKDPKQWDAWCQEMYEQSVALALAAEAKNPNEVKAIAAKLDTNCNACHGAFR